MKCAYILKYFFGCMRYFAHTASFSRGQHRCLKAVYCPLFMNEVFTLVFNLTLLKTSQDSLASVMTNRIQV